MESILLSIIIPIYNGEKTLNRCIESIYKQKVQPNLFEVICINDCSTDNTLNQLTELAQKYHNLIIINHSVNKRQGEGGIQV